MSIIQDKLGNEFLRSNGSMDSSYGAGMIMFSHLPPVTTFTRLAAHTVMHEPPPPDMILKKEPDSPDCTGLHHGGGLSAPGPGDYSHALGIKQERMSELDYRLPLYPGDLGKITELLGEAVSNNQSQQGNELNTGSLPGHLEKGAAGRKGRRSNGDGQEGKPRKRRSDAKAMMLDRDGSNLSPGSKPHICDYCGASFRSSYHLRRHVLIHTGERPFRCGQCNMSFIQKYLLQRHEKIHSGEKPFSCDQCNMRFIQKYHMERHKRTHSGEKPYRCETCQQYFSRTDRLLKHKRTCGDGVKKELEPGMMDPSCADVSQSSYGVTQGHAGGPGRRRGKSRGAGEGDDCRRRKGGPRDLHTHGSVAGSYSANGYPGRDPAVSSSSEPGMSTQQVRAPKAGFRRGGRKAANKEGQGKAGAPEQGGIMGEPGLLQGNQLKVEPSSSNYDDAFQFLKKRRHLQAAGSTSASGGSGGDYDVSVHLSSQQSLPQGAVSSLLYSDAPLSLDKSGIPDELLQTLLDHYAHKPPGMHPDPHFDMGDQHVELTPVLASSPDAGSPSEKCAMMSEYSRFLLQALERTTHSAGFPLAPPPPGPFSGSHSGNPPFADKSPYALSPLECGFGPPFTSSALAMSLPKSHFAMLPGSSPQHSFHLSGLEPPTQQQQQQQQQLTPSQELSEQMEKQQQHPQRSSSPRSSYQITPSELSGQREPPLKGASSAPVYTLVSSDSLTPLDSSKPSYQIENFAQAFGSQFKSNGHGFGADSGGEAERRIRTPVSEFSEYSSLLSDVGESVSAGSSTPTSQSLR